MMMIRYWLVLLRFSKKKLHQLAIPHIAYPSMRYSNSNISRLFKYNDLSNN